MCHVHPASQAGARRKGGPPNVKSETHQRRSRVALLVALLFAAPLIAALALRMSGWQPAVTGNHGVLVEPPVALPPGAVPGPLRDHWVLVGVASSQCGNCSGLVDDLMQVRRALGKDAARVKLVLSGPDRLPDARREAPLDIAPASLRRALRSANVAMGPGSLLVVDPRGFLMMRYAPGFRAAGLHDDLERLLRYDRVGVQQ